MHIRSDPKGSILISRPIETMLTFTKCKLCTMFLSFAKCAPQTKEMEGQMILSIKGSEDKFESRNIAMRQRTTENMWEIKKNISDSNISSHHAGLLQGCYVVVALTI